MANPSLSAVPQRPRALSSRELLRAGRILARLRFRIDAMLDDVEDCASVIAPVGESESVTDNAFDQVNVDEKGSK